MATLEQYLERFLGLCVDLTENALKERIKESI
jgi:predicted nucleotidyltransferase